MQLEIPERVNPNCYVFQMGFCYPVCIWNRLDFLQARDRLSQTVLGQFTTESHYYTANRIRPAWQDRADARWYAGQRLWREREHPSTDFWLVFRSESDRTLACMLLS